MTLFTGRIEEVEEAFSVSVSLQIRSVLVHFELDLEAESAINSAPPHGFSHTFFPVRMLLRSSSGSWSLDLDFSLSFLFLSLCFFLSRLCSLCRDLSLLFERRRGDLERERARDRSCRLSRSRAGSDEAVSEDDIDNERVRPRLYQATRKRISIASRSAT